LLSFSNDFNLNKTSKTKKMKKQLVFLTAILTTGALVFTACNKEDETAPVITLVGSETVNVDFKGTYTDEGATATDDEDGDITDLIDVENDVNTNSAQSYHVHYNVSDAAGNAADEVTRNVNVVIKGSHMVGTYNVVDAVTGGATSNYTDNITASGVDANRIFVQEFGWYENGDVYFDISGTNGTVVTLPSQQVMCGDPAALRTFVGTGTISANGNTITISYTETTGSTSVTGTETYTRQ
jgi:hypothetical protein